MNKHRIRFPENYHRKEFMPEEILSWGEKRVTIGEITKHARESAKERGITIPEQIKFTGENIIEMVRCDDKHTLMLNNMIVYSHPNLYTYDIILRLDNDLDHYGQKNIHSFVKYNYINYSNLRDIDAVRCLN